ncbi:MAG: 3-deoxy-D-manno-octulosonic acid transferase [Ferruginibacter sp.]|nr:3-deoxy-D-manno-octulosonic acid transferase [Ferruginibacter sp.]
MALLFYHIFLGAYFIGVRLFSWKSKKAQLWLAGRRNLLPKLQKWKNTLDPNDKVIWMHCASLGEFEQGRPILENIKNQYPNYKILLTFFSPSGYEVRKNYAGADAIFYLPLDGKFTSAKFIEIVKPSLVIWVKYEYWYYYLTVLKQKNIPVVLVSAIFRESQPFFKWYGKFWKKILLSFKQIFVQDENSVLLLNNIGFDSNIEIAGDTRFDRVIDIAEKKEPINEKLIQFCENNFVIVAGSTWEEDEETLVHYARTHAHIKFIIAPHEIDAERLKDIKKIFKNAIYFSDFVNNDTTAQVIIIDNIGMLAILYQLADITYIGGGFNDTGIHNVLEAAVFGKPVIFGPIYEKFSEAISLIEKGGAFSVANALELESLLDKFISDEKMLKNAAYQSIKYVYANKGATNKIVQYLQANRLLTN